MITISNSSLQLCVPAQLSQCRYNMYNPQAITSCKWRNEDNPVITFPSHHWASARTSSKKKKSARLGFATTFGLRFWSRFRFRTPRFRIFWFARVDEDESGNHLCGPVFEVNCSTESAASIQRQSGAFKRAPTDWSPARSSAWLWCEQPWRGKC